MAHLLLRYATWLSLASVMACNLDTPEDYYDTTTLNVNLYSDIGAEDFEQVPQWIEADIIKATLPDSNDYDPARPYEQYVEHWLIEQTEKRRADIAALKPTGDTEEMIARSLDLHDYVLRVYREDYLPIARLIDGGADSALVVEALVALDEEVVLPYWEKAEHLFEVAIPYGEANGMEISRY